MTNEEVEALFTRVNEDPALQARFKAVADEAEFDALISELGYELTYADFAQAAQDVELSEDELANVAGGELLIAAAGLFISGVIIGGGAGVAGAVAIGGLGTTAGFIAGTQAGSW